MLFIRAKALVFKIICCALMLFFNRCKHDSTNKDKQSHSKEAISTTQKNLLKATPPVSFNAIDTPSYNSFEYVGPEKQGLSVVASNGKYGYINHAKKVVIDLQFDDAQSFSEGLAPVKKNGKWGYINLRGNLKITPYLGIATPFNEGLAAVRKDYLWGYIDKNNQIIVPFEYDFAYPFNNSKAQVMKGTSWFYINTKGKTL